ncbi:hypothetical protein PO124_24940 [Bacillus licheniformis]|nr:hypothetical protein [Bacillus licheniformis]
MSVKLTEDIRFQRAVMGPAPRGARRSDRTKWGRETTLLKLISGQMKPDEGLVTWKKDYQQGSWSRIPHGTAANGKELLYDVFHHYGTHSRSFPESNVNWRLKRTRKTQIPLESTGLCRMNFSERRLRHQRANRTGGARLEYRAAIQCRVAGVKRRRTDESGSCKASPVSSGSALLDEPTNHLDLTSIEWLPSF